MELDPNSDEVIKLLTKLKNTNGTYPPDLLASRRARYMQQAAQLSLAAGAGAAIKEVVKSGKGTGLPPTAGTLLETILIVAIVAEAGAAAYFYRDKLADLFNIFSSKASVEEVATPPAIPSPLPQLDLTPSAVVTETETPVGTPSPTVVINGTNVSGNENVNPVNPVNPVPTDRNGNQYGLTPKPERTKDPKGNDNSSDTTTNNKDNSNNKPTK